MAIKDSDTDGVLLFISACMQKLNVHAEVMPVLYSNYTVNHYNVQAQSYNH